jgi:hypothetical protein
MSQEQNNSRYGLPGVSGVPAGPALRPEERVESQARTGHPDALDGHREESWRDAPETRNACRASIRVSSAISNGSKFQRGGARCISTISA